MTLDLKFKISEGVHLGKFWWEIWGKTLLPGKNGPAEVSGQVLPPTFSAKIVSDFASFLGRVMLSLWVMDVCCFPFVSCCFSLFWGVPAGSHLWGCATRRRRRAEKRSCKTREWTATFSQLIRKFLWGPKNNKQKTHKYFSDGPCGTIVPGTNPHPSQGQMGDKTAILLLN